MPDRRPAGRGLRFQREYFRAGGTDFSVNGQIVNVSWSLLHVLCFGNPLKIKSHWEELLAEPQETRLFPGVPAPPCPVRRAVCQGILRGLCPLSLHALHSVLLFRLGRRAGLGLGLGPIVPECGRAEQRRRVNSAASSRRIALPSSSCLRCSGGKSWRGADRSLRPIAQQPVSSPGQGAFGRQHFSQCLEM